MIRPGGSLGTFKNSHYAIGFGLFLILLIVMISTSHYQSLGLWDGDTKEPSNPSRNVSEIEAFNAISKMAQLLYEGGGVGDTKKCKFMNYGKDWGAHQLCEVNPSSTCRFVSFGIANDYSFDTDLATKAMCKGLALDPTVDHKSKLHESVWFLNMGATSLLEVPSSWIVTSVPSLLKWVHWDSIDVLKMDCEGCEYALARDIIDEDRDFFNRVHQFAFEMHISRRWVNSLEPIINLGKLFFLMEEAGLELITANIHDCHPDDEAPGCHPKLLELGYPCGSKKMCQDMLFARVS